MKKGPTTPADPQGPPGEVTTAALEAAIAGTSSNSNGVAEWSGTVSNPPTQAQVQSIADKLNELIVALGLSVSLSLCIFIFNLRGR